MGDDQWHLSGDDGIDGGKCARFYVTSNPPQANDDWLISPVFNVKEISGLAISFKYAFDANGISPNFYYASSFDGNPANSEWIPIDKSFWIDDIGWQDARIEIINQAENFVFAVRYEITSEDSYYFLMDNFTIESFIPPPPFLKVDSTQHFEFYTNIPDSSDFYVGMADKLENQFEKLASIWEKPESNVNIYEKKIKVYYSDINDISLYNEETPDWKAGFYNANNYSIYLSPINNENKSNFYSNTNLLAVSELSQLFLTLYNNLHYSNVDENNLIECFGLYESGVRPSRNNLNIALDELGHKPVIDDVKGLDKLSTEISRELCLSYVEACILIRATENINPYYHEEEWQQYLYYFYQIEENSAIRLSKQNSQFNIYCVPRDDRYIESIGTKVEELLLRYSTFFELTFKHPVNIIIYPTKEVGMAIDDKDGYNGGSAEGTDNFNILSPTYLPNGLSGALNGLIGHELFHVVHCNMISVNWIPYWPFYMEGFADYMGIENFNSKTLGNISVIQKLFNGFQISYNRQPTLEEIMKNNFKDKPSIGYIDPYIFGSIFYDYLIMNNMTDYLELKAFFAEGADWDVFQYTYDEINTGYINYLKSLAGITDIEALEDTPIKIYLESNQLIIQSNEQMQNAALEIFTFTGQKYVQKDLTLFPGETQSIFLPGLNANNYYIVRLIYENNSMVKKVFNSERL